jgi:hypothetical protein
MPPPYSHLGHSLPLKMEAVCFTNTLMNYYQATGSHIIFFRSWSNDHTSWSRKFRIHILVWRLNILRFFMALLSLSSKVLDISYIGSPLLPSTSFAINYSLIRACCSVVAKALCYKPEGCEFETWCGELIFSIYLILPAALGPGVYSASNRNAYQTQKNNISGEQSRASAQDWQPYRHK